ncbi:ATP-binding cassette domain-containing protein [Halomonas sp. ATBC28]|uniref:ATP-binding cassette domain-containing protein n=2 Tax=Gammaproteobacteria TaxID=1236 RepID=A0A7Z0LX68_9GAMM|nr:MULTISPECIES: ATP-binding cassette domain-containing protein [Halomonas]AEF05713.1 Iron-chelate-transporting ATPase [Alteromonas naphthalenivorans]NWO03102.1 ATP-binding cassette domain-containing protein [Idiomarinaceae bacterium]TMU18040.1 ATP-binding cassette domain-containing protein [Halomonas sp. ATBC28]HBK18292.1 hypothetical protein [Gammaproteobacteria bacterium]NYS80258.1 ATP-binding cassette domain-containing protein [Halomonas glaciei]
MSEPIERPLDALSGGPKQRVWITMTVVEETQLVLPDEPTLALDLGR